MRKSFFTLIELLVVIAAITILLTMLLPALSDAKVRAKIISEAANLRVLGLAITVFVEEHEDIMPNLTIEDLGVYGVTDDTFKDWKGNSGVLNHYQSGIQGRATLCSNLNPDSPIIKGTAALNGKQNTLYFNGRVSSE